jgi:outer membrane receptor protein involved in Fe transport
MRKLLFFFVLSISLFAKANLYIFIFKDGKSLQNVVVKAGDIQQTTNEYGYAEFQLESDSYEISYYKDDKLFALEDVNVVDEQDSQLFLNLENDKSKLDLDLPLEAYKQDFKKVAVKSLEGPKGTLELTLIDSKEKKPVKNAKLFFKGYALEAKSDENGFVKMEVPKGKYDISIVHPNYVMKIVKDVKVSFQKTTKQEVKLVKSDIALEEYVVLAPAVEGSLASTFAALKDSDVAGDAISSEQFSKSGDSSAAGALKRVTGITIVDGKYVFVRGLGERYSTVLLNDMHIPSPEPTKRVVPLDIFPAGVIQSMDIKKGYSVDLPGSFAGGSILINTKDIPKEDNYVKGSVAISYNGSTGKNSVYNADNSKPMPSGVISKSNNFQEVVGETDLSQSMTTYRSYNLGSKTIEPGKNISLGVGQSFKTSGGLKYGYVGSLYYKTDEDSVDAIKYSTNYDIPTKTLDQGERSDYQQTSLSKKYGGLISFGVDTEEGHKAKYTFLSLNDFSDTTTYTEKDGGATGPSTDDQKRTYYEYKEKTITAHQFNGEHHFQFGDYTDGFFDDIKFSWGFEIAEATRLEPGTVDYTYEKVADDKDYTLDKKIWYLYSNLKDEVTNLRGDFKLPFELNERDNYTSFGFFSYSKSRMLDNRRFKVQHELGNEVYDDIDTVFVSDNVDSGDLALTSNYRDDDAYYAKQDVSSIYFKQLLSVTNSIDFKVGIRQENSKQQLIDAATMDPYDPLVTSDVLPSLGINYRLNEDHQLRFSYANSLSRPDFREFSPNRYKDPVTSDIVFGYPDLKYTQITNIDLKYEWYISYDEIFSISYFQKDFINPIEVITNVDPDSQAGNKIISYRNALGAISTGVELSGRKKFDFISLDNYFFGFNYAVIDSKIKLDTNSDDQMIRALTTKDRPMQGQSPYVMNLKLGYDNINTGRSAVLLLNESGERITSLGTSGAPDYYEQPYKKMDFVLKWRLNDTYDLNEKKTGYTVSFKAQNLLDSEKKITQGSVVAKTYKPGMSYSFNFGVKY